MILFVTASDRAAECAAKLQQALGERVRLETSARRAVAAAREQEYSVLLLDELFAECDPRAAEQVMKQAATALPVSVNLALAGPERLLRTVRAALVRRDRERKAVQRAARTELWKELGADLTGILMAADLVLQTPHLPPDLRRRVASIHELACRVRGNLRSPGSAPV